MTWNALCLLMADADPEVRRLCRISIVFFALWIFDLILSIYFECLILNVNSLVVLHACTTLAAAAASCHYGHNSLTSSFFKGENSRPLFPSGRSRVQRRRNSSQLDANVNISCPFGMRRLFVLVSFGSTVFLMFGCLTMIGENLHHALHASDMPPALLIIISVCHVVLVTVYADEIDAYDCVSGRGVDPHDVHSLSTRQVSCTAQQLRKPAKEMSCGSLFFNRTVRAGARAFAPLTCIAVCLATMFLRNPLWEMGGAFLLAVYTCVVSFRKAKEMAWLLTNNMVCQPSVVAACDGAIRNVKLVEGVLQVQSAIFWEVAKGEMMALVYVRLMSSADPSAVTVAVRRTLEQVASHVFVEARAPHEEDDDADGPGTVDHSAHYHDHSHGCGHGHHFHGSAGERHEAEKHERCGQGVANKGEHDSLFPVWVTSSSISSVYFPPFSESPMSTVVELASRCACQQSSISTGNHSVPNSLRSFTLVPPPFPKPPS
ncbi:hypothetical protein TraAM80_04906 [Trypanosoma rangeli]|uniref:Uncharacterized protein n=1 Tax=Trypanosoma rangeli TaxID=5698 RepID=A0A422NH50_TRYRA|nr:uncharacterized protein TraAM80_04906 [Trypanosoma rangeli]RNF04781.1 hypothetical protein TraAM80_04906 [Trypanosoma rangeli]|eukprot:RNF04781.1 hypothetical protein TraAM80_04906 [Trypanosoma rangeli]